MATISANMNAQNFPAEDDRPSYLDMLKEKFGVDPAGLTEAQANQYWNYLMGGQNPFRMNAPPAVEELRSQIMSSVPEDVRMGNQLFWTQVEQVGGPDMGLPPGAEDQGYAPSIESNMDFGAGGTQGTGAGAGATTWDGKVPNNPGKALKRMGIKPGELGLSKKEAKQYWGYLMTGQLPEGVAEDQIPPAVAQTRIAIGGTQEGGPGDDMQQPEEEPGAPPPIWEDSSIENIIRNIEYEQDQANLSNEERYEQGLEELRGGYGAAREQIAGIGGAAREDIARGSEQSYAKGLQSLIGSGLGSTTITANLARATEEDRRRAEERLDESLAGVRAGLEERAGEGTSGFIERRTDAGPDMGFYADLIRSTQGTSPGETPEDIEYEDTGATSSANFTPVQTSGGTMGGGGFGSIGKITPYVGSGSGGGNLGPQKNPKPVENFGGMAGSTQASGPSWEDTNWARNYLYGSGALSGANQQNKEAWEKAQSILGAGSTGSGSGSGGIQANMPGIGSAAGGVVGNMVGSLTGLGGLGAAAGGAIGGMMGNLYNQYRGFGRSGS